MIDAQIDELWLWSDPVVSEQRFRDALSAADNATRGILHTQIARALGLQKRFDEAHAALDGVALDTADARLRARHALERGRILNTSGNKDAASGLFFTALEAASGAGLEYLAVDAAHMLGIVLPPSEALEWNRRAITMAETAGEARARTWLGPLYNNTAWTLYDLGRYEEALTIFERDVEHRRSLGRQNEERIARYSVGCTLKALGRTAEALDIQQKLVEELLGF